MRNEIRLNHGLFRHEAIFQERNQVGGTPSDVGTRLRDAGLPAASPRAVEESTGVLQAHLPALIRYAADHDVAIAIRRVEPAAATRIAAGYHTKNLHIKGKSSDWGPMRGLIPVDQSLSKLAGTGNPGRIAKATAAVATMLVSQTDSGVRERSRRIAENRVASFCRDRLGDGIARRIADLHAHTPYLGIPESPGSTARMKIVAARMELSLSEWTALGQGQAPLEGVPCEREFSPPRDGECRWFRFTRTGDVVRVDYAVPPPATEDDARRPPRDAENGVQARVYRPLEVVCYQPVGGGRPLPVTADYDLLLVMPHVDRHGPEDNVPMWFVTQEEHARYRGRGGQGIAPPPAISTPLAHPDLGNASRRIENMIEDLSCVLSENGEYRPLIHHGDDMHNPVSEENANYPALLVLPRGRTGAASSKEAAPHGTNAREARAELRVIDRKDACHRAIRILKDVGYMGFPNPLWRSEGETALAAAPCAILSNGDASAGQEYLGATGQRVHPGR